MCIYYFYFAALHVNSERVSRFGFNVNRSVWPSGRTDGRRSVVICLCNNAGEHVWNDFFGVCMQVWLLLVSRPIRRYVVAACNAGDMSWIVNGHSHPAAATDANVAQQRCLFCVVYKLCVLWFVVLNFSSSIFEAHQPGCPSVSGCVVVFVIRWCVFFVVYIINQPNKSPFRRMCVFCCGR